MPRLRFAACLLAASAIGLPAASLSAWAADTLTLYSAQHEQLVDGLAVEFTAQTGIAVKVRSGEAPEIASQIVKEGAHSPADVYFTENSPELLLLDERGLLAPLQPATLASVPRTYSAPDGDWVGVLARECVLAFNPKLVAENKLPASILDLARPEWKGRVAIAPSDADFLPLVGAVVALKGEPAALAWLRGLKTNAQVFDDDEGVVAAVDRGTAATGVINNYYWARLRTEQGAARTASQIHHFAGGDLGGLVNVSGAAVLKTAPHAAAAQRFVAFLVTPRVQSEIGAADVDFEYPLAPGAAPNKLLKPFSELQPPVISLTQVGDDQLAGKLLRQAGLI